MSLNLIEIPTNINKKLLEAAAKEVFLYLGDNFEANLKFVPEKEMVRLNHVYRGKKGSTDVLSFEYDGEKGGDIVITPKALAKDAKEWGFSKEKTAAILLVHGMLHVAGFDHIKETERAKMESAEKEILAKIDIDLGEL